MDTDDVGRGGRWAATLRRLYDESDKDRVLQIIFYSGVLVFVLFMLVTGWRFEWEDRLFAVVVGVPTIPLVLIQLAFLFKPGLKDRFSSTDGSSSLQEKFSQSIEGQSESDRDPAQRRKIEAVLAGWLIALPIALYYLGMILTIPVWVFGFVWYFYRDLKIAAATTVFFVVLFYLVFIVFLDLTVWDGVLLF